MIPGLTAFIHQDKPYLTKVYSASHKGSSGNIGTVAGAGQGVAAGDLAIIFKRFDSTPTITTPGWTTIASVGPGNGSIAMFAKVLVTADLGSTITSTSTNPFDGWQLYYSPSVPIRITGTQSGAQSTTIAPSVQTMSISDKTNPVIACACASPNSGTPVFASESPAFQEDNLDGQLRMGASLYNNSPVTQTIASTDVGTNQLISGFIDIFNA